MGRGLIKLIYGFFQSLFVTIKQDVKYTSAWIELGKSIVFINLAGWWEKVIGLFRPSNRNSNPNPTPQQGPNDSPGQTDGQPSIPRNMGTWDLQNLPGRTRPVS